MRRRTVLGLDAGVPVSVATKSFTALEEDVRKILRENRDAAEIKLLIEAATEGHSDITIVGKVEVSQNPIRVSFEFQHFGGVKDRFDLLAA